MMRELVALCVVVAMGLAGVVRAQEGPQAAKPEKEHGWLGQLVGEWEVEMEAVAGPEGPVVKGKGTESVRKLGELWTIAEGVGEGMGLVVKSRMTLGYDPAKKKYVGTWVDSCQTTMWVYEGTVEGNTLTLETEGPNPMWPGKVFKYREAIEVKGKDEKVMTSSIRLEDGTWVKFMTATYRRKK